MVRESIAQEECIVLGDSEVPVRWSEVGNKSYGTMVNFSRVREQPLSFYIRIDLHHSPLRDIALPYLVLYRWFERALPTERYGLAMEMSCNCGMKPARAIDFVAKHQRDALEVSIEAG
jgi:hypothetical protein